MCVIDQGGGGGRGELGQAGTPTHPNRETERGTIPQECKEMEFIAAPHILKLVNTSFLLGQF